MDYVLKMDDALKKEMDLIQSLKDLRSIQHTLNIKLIKSRLNVISNRPGFDPLDYSKFLEEKYFMMAACGCDFSDVTVDEQELVLACLKKM